MLSIVYILLFAGVWMAERVTAQAVFAHFMAQNSYSYNQDDWAKDISTAQSIGIDGFALNVAAYDYEVDRIVDAYAIAERLNFKLFYSFDMYYDWSQENIVKLIKAHASSSASYRWEGALLVSTYSGENRGDAFWAGLKSTLAAQGVPIKLAPAFSGFRAPNRAAELASTFPSIDGFFNWWSWPEDNGNLLTTATDIAYRDALASRSGPYIMSVSPWQFKELGGGNNWVQLSDTLWDYRWRQAINEVKPDIVEIVTWNDYAESHYIGDINPKVDLGSLAPKYVNGFVHSPWRIIAKYFITYYKTGKAPAITNDQVVFWYRAHPKGVSCNEGDRPRNSAYPADAIFAMALLSSQSTVTLDVGSKHSEFTAGPGIAMGSVSFPTEDAQIPFIQIKKNGSTVKSGYGSTYITNSCSYYNFNPFVGVIG